MLFPNNSHYIKESHRKEKKRLSLSIIYWLETFTRTIPRKVIEKKATLNLYFFRFFLNYTEPAAEPARRIGPVGPGRAGRRRRRQDVVVVVGSGAGVVGRPGPAGPARRPRPGPGAGRSADRGVVVVVVPVGRRQQQLDQHQLGQPTGRSSGRRRRPARDHAHARLLLFVPHRWPLLDGTFLRAPTQYAFCLKKK